MINNYYTLKALVEEIGHDVESSVVEACYTRTEQTLELILDKGTTQRNVLVVSCRPRLNYMYFRGAPRRHMGANVIPAVPGKKIASISAVRNERTVRVTFSDGNYLAINLFGAHANVYLVGENGQVVDVFLRKNQTGTLRVTSDEGHPVLSNKEEFVSAFAAATGSPLKRLSALIPPLAGELVKEISYRLENECGYGISGDSSRDLDAGVVEAIFEMVMRVQEELFNPLPRIYYDGPDPVMMSIIEMRHLKPAKEERYESVNVCVAAFSAERGTRSADKELVNSALTRLTKRKEELSGTIDKIGKEISGNRESEYRTVGDIIMQHLGDIAKGLQIYVDPEGGTAIHLDPGLTPVQNAQAYYEKAKKARESYRQALTRRRELSRQLGDVETKLSELKSGTVPTSLTAVAKAEKIDGQPSTPFREFEKNGFKIYVGKDAKNNDKLTFGFGKPNDVFMHARGVSGSHVIIRNASKEYPQKAVLEFAARIAAHYSKARSSGLVPVSYTMRKFVKKARGKPGAVILDREEVIMVKPGIPLQPR